MEIHNNQYGQILFTDQITWKSRRFNQRLGVSIYLGVGILLLLVLPFAKNVSSFILLAIGGIIIIIMGLYRATLRYLPFCIYQQGIRLSPNKIQFIRFDDIDHISKIEDASALIELKNGNTFIIAANGSHLTVLPNSGYDMIMNWSKAYNIIADQLLALNKGIEKYYLVRNVVNIPWSNEAIAVWKKRMLWFDRSAVIKINEESIKQGRTLVELSDVNKIIK